MVLMIPADGHNEHANGCVQLTREDGRERRDICWRRSSGRACWLNGVPMGRVLGFWGREQLVEKEGKREGRDDCVYLFM